MRNSKRFVASIIQVILAITLLGCGSSGGGQDFFPVGESRNDADVSIIDLEGAWGTGVLSSGVQGNYWERGILTVSADNTTSYSSITSQGTSTVSSGMLSTSQNGTVTLAGGPDLDVYGDAGGSLLHGVMFDTAGTARLFTAVKSAGAYEPSELQGVWQVNILISGESAPWWERGTVTVDAAGNFAAATVDMFGDPGYLVEGGSLDLSSDGLVTMPVFSTLQGVMNADKDLIVWTDTWPDGTTELAVLTRQADSYRSTDVEGIWQFSSLSTGMASSAARGTITVSPGGAAAVTFENAAEAGAYERRISISADGRLALADKDGVSIPDVGGFMDSGRTIMVFTETLMADNEFFGSIMTICTKR